MRIRFAILFIMLILSKIRSKRIFSVDKARREMK